MQRPDGKDGKVQDRLQSNSRIWNRANTVDEKRQPQVSIGVPVQLIVEEGVPPSLIVSTASCWPPCHSCRARLQVPQEDVCMTIRAHACSCAPARKPCTHSEGLGRSASTSCRRHVGQSPEDVREAAGNAGLRAPYLGKPLFADGREGSHGLLVIKDEQGLQQLAAGSRPAVPALPVILQQYVPHGACLFKVCQSHPPPARCTYLQSSDQSFLAS